MADARPGLSAERLVRLVRDAVNRCALDLSGLTVLTEAATGPYVVTPVLAALAGAEVLAITSTSTFGTVEDVESATRAVADALCVTNKITITTERTPELFEQADVVTNSGHVRPIVGEFAAAIKPTAVVPLMFESWEVQAGRFDIDVELMRARGVQMAGTNERHPDVDVFSYLGPTAVVQLADAGIPAYRTAISVLCDNPFSDYIVSGLCAAGATVQAGNRLPDLLDGPAPEALLIAMTPTGRSIVTTEDVSQIAATWPGSVVVQFWGDVDRTACTTTGVPVWPIVPPAAGHMGVLPSRVGPDPVVRLQAGGLKVAQVLRTPPKARSAADLERLDAF